MSTTHIKPTLGRIVWYRGADGESRSAIVTRVHGDFLVNLYVFGLDGLDTDCCMREDVTHADPEQEPGCFPSWHWMPYQVEQAKKAEKDACEAKSLAAAPGHDYAAESRRLQALQMALSTPGVSGPRGVLDAAAAYQKHMEGTPAPTDAEIAETFSYQVSIDGGDIEKAAINTYRVLRGERLTLRERPDPVDPLADDSVDYDKP